MGRLRWAVLLVCGATLWIGTPGTAAAASIPARAALEKAMEAATQWQPDAVLTGVSSNNVNGDGTAESWAYTFYSPKAKKWNIITGRYDVRMGLVVDTLPVLKGSVKPVATDFLDSDKAMAAAKEQGMKGEKARMGLTEEGWAIIGGPGDISVWLNARTGALIRKQ